MGRKKIFYDTRFTDMAFDKAPFTDIRVRQALQMAIDRKAIAASYFDGIIDGVPAGIISPLQIGWCTPYEKWSEDLKQLYSYNPEKAKKLLAEAGYPKGFDTNIIASQTGDLELLQIIKSMFQDIAVPLRPFPERQVGAIA